MARRCKVAISKGRDGSGATLQYVQLSDAPHSPTTAGPRIPRDRHLFKTTATTTATSRADAGPLEAKTARVSWCASILAVAQHETPALRLGRSRRRPGPARARDVVRPARAGTPWAAPRCMTTARGRARCYGLTRCNARGRGDPVDDRPDARDRTITSKRSTSASLEHDALS